MTGRSCGASTRTLQCSKWTVTQTWIKTGTTTACSLDAWARVRQSIRSQVHATNDSDLTVNELWKVVLIYCRRSVVGRGLGGVFWQMEHLQRHRLAGPQQWWRPGSLLSNWRWPNLPRKSKTMKWCLKNEFRFFKVINVLFAYELKPGKTKAWARGLTLQVLLLDMYFGVKLFLRDMLLYSVSFFFVCTIFCSFGIPYMYFICCSF